MDVTLPMHRGEEPLHMPSAWQILVLEPTKIKGGLQLKDTSD